MKKNNDMKKQLKELKKMSKDNDTGLKDIIKMVENPTKYFKDNPIKEDWPDPPKAPTKAEIKKALSKDATVTDKIRMYGILTSVSHFQKRKSKKDPNFKYASKPEHWRTLEIQIADILTKHGYRVETQANVSQWNSMQEPKLHFGVTSGLCLHEIPRIEGTGIKIQDYLMDENGKIRSYDELIRAYQDKNATENNFNELIQDLDDKQKQMINEFLQDSGINQSEIKKINVSDESTFGYILEIETFSREYEIMESEQNAEDRANDLIDNDSEMEYFWKCKIESDHYRGSLDDFIQAVKDDGWYYQLCRYDHNYETTENGFVYWRSN